MRSMPITNYRQGSHWTLDMAANNNTFIQSLGDLHTAELPDVAFDPKECRIQCFPHIINTCVQHTIKALNNGIDTDIDDSDEAENDSEPEGNDDEESENDSEESDGEGSDDNGNGNTGAADKGNIAIHADLLNKIRALVKGIRASGQRQEHFNNVIQGGNQYGWWKDGEGKSIIINPRQLLRDVRTRWDSTYQMLVRVRELRQVSLLL